MANIHDSIVIPDSEDEVKEVIKDETVKKFLFASMIPNENEYQELNYIFTPFDIVDLVNTSKYRVQVSGNLLSIRDDYEGLEEEEELKSDKKEKLKRRVHSAEAKKEINQGEEIDMNELKKKIAKMIGEKGYTIDTKE